MYCPDKLAFNSRGEAYDFLRNLRNYKNSQIYECRVCGKWHLSHFKKGRFKMKQQTLQEANTFKPNHTLINRNLQVN